MARKVTTHLMFTGSAEEAMTLYVSLFGDSEVTQIERYGPGEMGPEGSVKRADFVLAGREFLCIDSPVEHAFTFTPSMSLFVECESEAELEAAFARLSDGGECAHAARQLRLQHPVRLAHRPLRSFLATEPHVRPGLRTRQPRRS